MREAVIVSAARTPIGRAFRGAFNQTPGATMAGHAVKHAIERAAIEPGEVDDVVMGCGLPEGATGNNIGRTAALRAGCPVTVPGETVSRFCASGLDAIAIGAKRVIVDGADVIVAGGVESISMVQNDVNVHFITEEWLLRHHPDLYMPMLFTADFVAKQYSVSRERQDEYALQSQQRTAAAQAAGRFDAEIVPMASWKSVQDRESGAVERRSGRAQAGRRQSPRHDARRIGCAQRRGSRRRRYVDHGRQLVAALRRRGGGRDRRLRVCRAPQSRTAGNLSRLCGGGDASRARWESGRCMPCRSCSSSTA